MVTSASTTARKRVPAIPGFPRFDATAKAEYGTTVIFASEMTADGYGNLKAFENPDQGSIVMLTSIAFR